MVGAEESDLVSQEFLERRYGARRIPGLSPPERKVVTGGQYVGVVGAEESRFVVELGQFLVGCRGACWVSCMAAPGR